MQELPLDIIQNFLQKTDAAIVPQSPQYIQLRNAIEYLIETDFHALIQLLYRIDVNEAQLKKALNENLPEQAADVITQFIIRRQAEKIAFRKNMQKNNNINEEDKW